MCRTLHLVTLSPSQTVTASTRGVVCSTRGVVCYSTTFRVSGRIPLCTKEVFTVLRAPRFSKKELFRVGFGMYGLVYSSCPHVGGRRNVSYLLCSGTTRNANRIYCASTCRSRPTRRKTREVESSRKDLEEMR